MFDDLHSEFEKKNTNLFELQRADGFSKYILIRSLDTQTLKDIILKKTTTPASSSKQDDLYKELFETDIDIDELIEYIKKGYPAIREMRKNQEQYLPAIIEDFGDVKCGIRNDNMNDVAKALVRDKSIQSKQELEAKVDELLDGTIKGYILWQYYNQATNDLIEHLVNDYAEVVIPTLRKIHDIDFFIKINGEIIPFDLKITHISNDFFDQYMKGINPNNGSCNNADDYCVDEAKPGEIARIKSLYQTIKENRLPKMTGQTKEDLKRNLKSLKNKDVDAGLEGLNELQELKAYYTKIKKEHDLPNMSDLTTEEMLDISAQFDQDAADKLITELFQNRQNCITHLGKDRKILEWWNYKNQGERLFKNNNRFFIFLAYRNSFEDARPLKGNVKALERYIHQQLDLLSQGKGLNIINYFYEKDKNLRGSYTINSTSVIYSQ